MYDGACLWGFSRDMMALTVELGLPTNLGGELAVAVFKYCISHWQEVAMCIKFAAEARPGYKPKFYDYPSISIILSFYRAAFHAYVEAVQSGDVKPPAGLEALAAVGSWKYLDATDPMKGHPGWTPEMEKTYAKTVGSAAAA